MLTQRSFEKPQIATTDTLAAIVARHPASARVFQAHRLDFCCHGEQTLEEALRGRPERAEAILGEVEDAVRSLDREVVAEDVASLSTAALVSRIIERHHGFLRRQLPAIAPLAEKVARVHGEHNPKLIEVAAAFEELRRAVEPHLDEEEQVLFPALMARHPDPAAAAGGLGRMFEDHLVVGRLIGHLREQTDDYRTPEWGCRSYRLLMSELEDLETDLLRHVHLENHVLMPRFVERH
ncbi:MAG TPA: iron-sulfur cluster repair di-iron protein [Anaeromyxobacteraceae bacterium]|nr:iron-sulfur cluster repair di-iron protein [Anaeromyxobacteraceae bacterium]